MEPLNQMEHKSQAHFAKWSLIVGIVVVLNMFFNYAISLVYKEPDFQAMMARPQVVPSIQTQKECIAVGGQWTETTLLPPAEVKGEQVAKGYCDPDYTKRMHYEELRKVYQRNVFGILIILGVLAIIGGVVVSQEILTVAFSWGGVLSLVIASLRYWSLADNFLKVFILALALGGLVWVSIKKFGK